MLQLVEREREREEREREREREREHQCFPAQTKRERKLTLLLQLADFIVDVVVRAPV
jgi:hypothetical protein